MNLWLFIHTGTQNGEESQQDGLQIGENKARKRVAQSETKHARTEAVLKFRNFHCGNIDFICTERELLTDKTCQACMKGVNGTWYSNIWLVILSEVIPWINVSSVMSVMATAANFCYPRNLLKYFKIYFSYKLSLSRKCHMCWMHSALQRILHIWSDCSIKLFEFVQSSVSTSLSLTLAIKYRASV